MVRDQVCGPTLLAMQGLGFGAPPPKASMTNIERSYDQLSEELSRAPIWAPCYVEAAQVWADHPHFPGCPFGDSAQGWASL